ncbi:hypothetical protein CVT25_013770 [Psilocybe cyanescens]|uniref:T6SS Phospholipase effector Tle1-like catalytic domain-containing protein n=1 Tax=Psilocybe cyanescens TaxID=93625 RepID=A0A409XUV9_PSICY|nr:hypothetical protein CVT25_013770 [Psilocybe cyanescens]
MDHTPIVIHTNDDDHPTLKTFESGHISCLCKPLSNGQFGRNLVVSIDGTANQFGLKNTNIIELYSRLVKDETQLTYYNSGIGTYVADSKSSLKQSISHKWDMAFAANFKIKVLKAYEWLSENYKPGDRIFLFGFSRGAYQVRVIAGMIEKDITLKPLYIGSHPAIPKDREFSSTVNSDRNSSKGGSKETPEHLCEQFKKSLSNDEVIVHFVGSWDTVSSIGILKGESLPETTTGMTHVCAFRHALALDELRVKFLPEYANGGAGPPTSDSTQSANSSNGIEDEKASVASPNQHFGQFHYAKKRKGGNIKEVWFAGSHSDNNQFGPSLRWMTYEALIWGLKMKPFDQTWAPLTPKPSMNWKWNILENLPISRLSYESSEGVTRWPHRKKPRRILDGQLVHESVFELINPPSGKQASETSYRPKAELPAGKKWVKEQLTQDNIIESDPYIQPDRILVAINEANNNKEQNPECFDLTPIEFRDDSIPTPHASAWKALNDLYPEGSPARSKFLHRFADWQTRMSLVKEEIELYRDVLQFQPQPARHTRIDSIKKLAVALLNSLILNALQDAGWTYKQWLRDLYKEALRFSDLSYTKRFTVIKSLANEIDGRYEAGQESYLDERISLFKNVFDLTPLEHVNREDYLLGLLPTLYQRFEETSRQEDIVDIIAFNTEILGLLSAAHPHPAASTLAATLVSSYLAQFRLTGQFYHIDEALVHLQESILNSPSSDPNRADLYDMQGNWFHLRFKETGQSSYLDHADRSYNRAFDIRRSFEPGRTYPRDRQAALLWDRFKLTRQRDDLEESIKLHRESINLLSLHPIKRAASVFDLADALLTLFKESGQQADLEDAILHYEEALKLNPPPRFQRSKCLNGLAVGLRIRFEKIGRRDDLDNAISLYQEALGLCPPPYLERDNCLSGLAAALASRFTISRQKSDLVEAIQFYKQALGCLPFSHPRRANSLFGIAGNLHTLFMETSQPDGLEEAISLYRQALELLPSPHVDRADTLFGLAASLQSFHKYRLLAPQQNDFKETSQQDKLDEAMPLHSEPLELPASPDVDRANSLNALTAIYQNFHRQRLSTTQRSLPFNGLGLTGTLQTLSKKKTSDTLGEAMSLRRESLKLPISQKAERTRTHSGTVTLSGIPKDRLSVLQGINEQTAMRHYAELDEAILLLKESLELRPLPHPARIDSLSSLVNALENRFGNTDNPELLLYRNELLHLQSPYFPHNPSTLSNAV